MDNEIKHIDPASRDYEFSDVKLDERFVQINKEVIVTTVMFFIHSALIVANLYIGSGDPANYVYILGFPQWLFMQFCEFVVYTVCAFLLITYYYKDMDITANGKVIHKLKR